MHRWLAVLMLIFCLVGPDWAVGAPLDPGRPSVEPGIKEGDCQPLDFTEVRLERNKDGGLVIMIKGSKPDRKLRLRLVPVLYLRKPDYWLHQLVGCVSAD